MNSDDFDKKYEKIKYIEAEINRRLFDKMAESHLHDFKAMMASDPGEKDLPKSNFDTVLQKWLVVESPDVPLWPGYFYGASNESTSVPAVCECGAEKSYSGDTTYMHSDWCQKYVKS